MFLTVLDFLFVYIFGLTITFSFLGIEKSRKNNVIIIIFSAVLLILQATIFLFTNNAELIVKIYPLIVHLPIVLMSVFIFKKKLISSLCSIFLAYSFCALRSFVGNSVSLFYDISTNQKQIINLVVTPILLFLTIKFITPYVLRIFNLPNKKLSLIFYPSAISYILIYIWTVYYNAISYLHPISAELIIAIMFGIAMYAYIILSLIKICDANQHEQNEMVLNIKLTETERLISEAKISQQNVSVIRHDIRHYLNILKGLAEDGNTDKIKEYLGSIEDKLDSTVVNSFCKNESVNIVLSSYIQKANINKIKTEVTAKLSEISGPKELDFCVVLSNALENAIKALGNSSNSFISVNIGTENDKIIMQIKNTCNSKIEFKDDLPESKEKGHGLGTYSIKTIAEKYGGTVNFKHENNIFILQLVM